MAELAHAAGSLLLAGSLFYAGFKGTEMLVNLVAPPPQRRLVYMHGGRDMDEIISRLLAERAAEQELVNTASAASYRPSGSVD